MPSALSVVKPYLLDKSEKVTNTTEIQRRAQVYYGTLCSRPLEKYREDDERLEVLLQKSRVDDMALGVCFIVEDVQMARQSLKPGKTCGGDVVVAEMLRDTSAAD